MLSQYIPSVDASLGEASTQTDEDEEELDSFVQFSIHVNKPHIDIVTSDEDSNSQLS